VRLSPQIRGTAPVTIAIPLKFTRENSSGILMAEAVCTSYRESNASHLTDALSMTRIGLPLAVVNAETATFDCSFGRGCDGLCCRNGRPSVSPMEEARIRDNLAKFLPHLRPDARKLIERDGFLSRRTKLGRPMVRVSKTWCVFFNAGCVLHKVGVEDGDSFQYKPTQCALFPLELDTDKDEWFVRQWNYRGEEWDLFCLNPLNTTRKAMESLAAEIALAETGDCNAAFTPEQELMQ
jgi:hypothetical protein